MGRAPAAGSGALDNRTVSGGEKREVKGRSLASHHPHCSTAQVRFRVGVREVWVGIPPLSMSSPRDPEPQFPLLETGEPDAHLLWWLGRVRQL